MQSNACNWWDTMTVERRVLLFLLWLESSMRSNWCESWSRWCMCTFMPIANHVLSRMHFTDWVRLLLYLQKWQDEVKSWSGKLIFFSLLQYIIYAATRGKQTRTARAFFQQAACLSGRTRRTTWQPASEFPSQVVVLRHKTIIQTEQIPILLLQSLIFFFNGLMTMNGLK